MDDVEYDLGVAMVSMVNGALMAKVADAKLTDARGEEFAQDHDAIGDREIGHRVFRF